MSARGRWHRLPRLLELAAPWFTPKTRGLFLKGRDVKSEIEVAQRDWDFAYELHPSLTASNSAIVEIARLDKRKKAKSR